MIPDARLLASERRPLTNRYPNDFIAVAGQSAVRPMELIRALTEHAPGGIGWNDIDADASAHPHRLRQRRRHQHQIINSFAAGDRRRPPSISMACL